MYREWHSLSDTGPTTCQGSEDFLRVGLCSQELLLGESTLKYLQVLFLLRVCMCGQARAISLVTLWKKNIPFSLNE